MKWVGSRLKWNRKVMMIFCEGKNASLEDDQRSEIRPFKLVWSRIRTCLENLPTKDNLLLGKTERSAYLDERKDERWKKSEST